MGFYFIAGMFLFEKSEGTLPALIVTPLRFSEYFKAFKQESEPRLVEALRKTDSFIPDLSLVAVRDGKVAGHVLFSRIAIQTKEGDVPALALAPIAVLPECQGRGIDIVSPGRREKSARYKIYLPVKYPARSRTARRWTFHGKRLVPVMNKGRDFFARRGTIIFKKAVGI